MTPQSEPIEAGKVVGIYYTVKGTDGEVLETNRRGGPPALLLHGAGNVLKGVEEALVGKRRDDYVEVTLPADKAYGPRHEDRIQEVPLDALPQGTKLEAGMRVQGQNGQGQPVAGIIVEVGDEVVKVDHNHPLAGKELRFEVTVCGVRDATPEEQAYGRPTPPSKVREAAQRKQQRKQRRR